MTRSHADCLSARVSRSGHPPLPEPLLGVRQERLRAQLQRHLVLPPVGRGLLLPPPPPPPPAERVSGHQALRDVSSSVRPCGLSPQRASGGRLQSDCRHHPPPPPPSRQHSISKLYFFLTKGFHCRMYPCACSHLSASAMQPQQLLGWT